MADLLSLNICVVCGEPILYKITPETTSNGHSICNDYYDNQAVNVITQPALIQTKNPYEIAIMKNPAVRMHDVKTHILVGT